jgi:DNA-binding MarR family transcriptional regulator
MSSHYDLVLSLADAWGRLEHTLDANLSGIRGVSFAEYRLLESLASSATGALSRVDLAEQVGLTPSGVTRALRPLEKLHMVETHKAERDARLSMAALTDAGEELVQDCSHVIEDVLGSLLKGTGRRRATVTDLLDRLGD